jgi:hypothetical protein
MARQTTPTPKRKAGRPPLPAHLRRQVIQPSVLLATLDRLAAIAYSRRHPDGSLPSTGEVIDWLVTLAHPEEADE